MERRIKDFQLQKGLMRYSAFVPKFYNLCKSYGFKPGRIMPSRAFCSDENQGFPIILIAKHFGTFPFNHGMVGGIVATDRHGPHAHHGRDLAIIQASHVGYDPETKEFGVYNRLQMEKTAHTASCGKIGAVLDWYQQAYDFAADNIAFRQINGEAAIIIDNQYLENDREQGLFLHLDRMIAPSGDGLSEPLSLLSTSAVFPVHPALREKLPRGLWQAHSRQPIGRHLKPDLFYFKRSISDTLEGRDQLEKNLARYVPWIVTSPSPHLSAAMANTRIEFDRTFRTLIREPGYRGKNLAFISGLNIDISPKKGQLFPLTKFVPWAAYIQTRDGRAMTLEQDELAEALLSMEQENPDRIELSKAIMEMENRPEIRVDMPDHT